MSDDFSSGEWTRAATQAGNAFSKLREDLRNAARVQVVPTPDAIVGDRYRVVRAIGDGGFGNVYLVEHKLLGRQFAMKVLNSRIAEDPDWVARFHEEARATSQIGHENIVYVTDFGQDPTYGYYFIMEFLEGESLEELLITQGPQPIERILKFVHAAASALGAVHELGIVHCDLKPSNVFVVERKGREEAWKFLDFGTSTIVMNAVATEALYGTPKYMAPEQSVGLDVDARADQFSVACIVYEMLTGETPWNVTTWLQAMPEARRRRPPRPPSELRRATPRGWDDLVMRGLSVDPKERFPTIDDFARALGRAAKVEFTPSVDPMDASRSQMAGFERSHTAPAVPVEQERTSLEENSLDVEIDEGESQPTVTVTFRTDERLKREYRRNLSVGGLFVPCEELVPLRSFVTLELVYTPASARATVEGTVVGHETRHEAGRGFGVAISPQARGALDAFMAEIEGPALAPDDVLTIARETGEGDQLSPGEVFVLSRIDDGIPLSRLRSMCAGLPFDIGAIVQDLRKKGLIAVNDEDGGEASRSHLGVEPAFEPSQIRTILERLEFHRLRGNFLGASDVLERAISVAPDIAEFHFRRAELLREFDRDRAIALDSARQAVRLAPSEPNYRTLLQDLEENR